ncbi:MAG: alanine racemase [Bacteroidia bacterium]|nr:alanine racemase [Bacteroidia bacterium]
MDNIPLTYIAYDSRKISRGAETVFIALKTENRDGHDFIADAYQKGVRNFLVEKALPYKDVNYAFCDNCLDSLQRWALAHRQKFSYPVIGITGSNGKTIVKEWLASLLEMQFQIVKSPMSYNSQLGVSLSLLQMHPQAELALIEAGISEPEEMGRLWLMIQPDLGILTHMGSSHAEGFTSEAAKLQEKLQLFEGTEKVFTGSEQDFVLQALEQNNIPFESSQANYPDENRFPNPADRENAALAITVAKYLGATEEDILERLALLQAVEMRTEIITDNPEISLINDSYNSDEDSLRNALQLLLSNPSHDRKQIILSDIPHLGNRQKEIQQAIYEELREQLGEENIYTLGPVFSSMNLPQSFPHTEALKAELRYEDFKDSVLLLKGARSFALETLLPFFNRKLNATYFKVRLHQLSKNFRSLKAQIPEGTHTMCMVKAASYGSGTWEIAQVLEQEGATYLTVAYASEGIELRQDGIRLPIMVMNPDESSIESLIQFSLEPEVSNFSFLDKYLKAARLAELSRYRIHLKLETGMGRLGFVEEDLSKLIDLFSLYPDLEIVSVLSHLAAADDPSEDAFSHAQIERFQQMYQSLQSQLGIQSFRHILNTAGILRFPQYAFEMVRMGIGLYGIHPAKATEGLIDLEEIGSLHSSISQIRSYSAGQSIGYGRSQETKRQSRIATVAIGYADGIPRSLGEGNISFLVRGKEAPTFGRLCMDMLMLDVTDIPEAEAGDSVLIFGREGEHYLSINKLAEAADTIPYEILVRLSSRIRRIYERV